LLESQETLEDYQKKTQERIRKVRTKVNEINFNNMVDPPPKATLLSGQISDALK
jgi:hypothetical protein